MTSLLGCSIAQPTVNQTQMNSPDWFINRLVSPSKGEILGFGSGKDIKQAKTNALADIASQIHINVAASVEQISISNTKKELTKFSALQKSSSTKFEILGAVEVKKVINSSGVYVIYSYQPESWQQRVLALLPTINCDELQILAKNKYLEGTPFYSQIKSRLGCMPAFELWSDNQQWFISYGNKSQVLTVDFYELFYANIKSPILNVDVSNKNLKHNELYFLNYASGQKGFVSLFQISPFGDALLFVDNEFINKTTTRQYPDPSLYQGLAAIYDTRADGEHHNTGTSVNNLVMAAICDTARSFLLTPKINTSTTSVGTKRMLPALLKQLGNCEMATQIITISSPPLSEVR